MKQIKRVTGAVLVVLLLGTAAMAADSGPVAWWNFDEGQGKAARDSVADVDDAIVGNFWHMQGVAGTGVKFDGFTTHVARRAAGAPKIKEAFTIEAWIAPQAFPFNWCALVNQERDHEAGYFFGIGELGQITLQLAAGGKWQECTSKKTVPFMTKWSHVVGTFQEGEGMTLYIDGEEVGRLRVEGKLTLAPEVDFQIGRNHKKTLMNRESLVRQDVNFPWSYSFDGIIDELKVYDRALTANEIEQAYRESDPKSPPPLKWRKLPTVPESNRFGATYAKLKFYPEWDDLWRVGDHPDITVTFDEYPYAMVFWRGTNYNMNLVTENGKWVGDQSAEGGEGEVIGCCEHMSDKQCRYAHVRIIENHDARVVVHWRYAVNDVLYRIANAEDGWGAWADEYYYIYPDGAAVRHFTIYNMEGASITEPASFNNPGEKAEDNLEVEAVTMANMAGEIRSFSWDPWPNDGRVAAPFDNALEDANICIVNFKSKSKPYYIYEEGTTVIPYGGGTIELRPEYSKFPTWNHWPVSQAPSDGRYALVADRVSSSAVTSPEPPMRRTEDGRLVGEFIMGLTTEPIEGLAPLARAWLHAPELTVTSGDFTSSGYDKSQRGFQLERNSTGKGEAVAFEIAASHESPIVNPAFVIKNWGEGDAVLTLGGKQIPRGKVFRQGHDHRLEGSDLVVWLKTTSEEPVTISLSPAGS